MMEKKQKKVDRRDFLKTMGSAALMPVLAGMTSSFAAAKFDTNEPDAADTNISAQFIQVPRRKFGKTGIEIPSLSLGTIFDVSENQIILRKALQWGVTYWDTAHGYAGGNSELGIGKFLSKNPKVRKKLFIATKASGAETVADVEKCLQTSLERMNTRYIDLYYGVHALSDPAQLTDELKQWAENAKKRKLIRFFGFSTHKNMAKCLTAAAGLDWIDAIMTKYNFRSIQEPKMHAAVEACYKAGIAIIAMKTQAKQVETENDKELAEKFLHRGFTEGQAKIKIVLQNNRISAVCVGRDNLAHLALNVAAVLDKTELSQADKDVLKQYARATCSGYCAGCGHICDSALPDVPYVSDIMRYLMYYNSYGEKDLAKGLFARIPAKTRANLISTDYHTAQTRCPQHLPIARLIAEAVSKLA